MAVEALTIGTLKSRIHHALANTSTVDANLGTELGWHINAVVRDMVCRSQHPAFRVEATIAASVAGSDDYDMPADLFTIINGTVRHDATDYAPLQWYDQETFDSRRGALAYSTAGKPILYTLRNRHATTGLWQLRLVPTPDANYTIRYWYFAIPTNVSVSGDSVEVDVRFPREYGHGIVEGVLTKLPSYLSPMQLSDAQIKYETVIRSMANNKNPVTNLFAQNQPYQPSQIGGITAWPRTLTPTVHP